VPSIHIIGGAVLAFMTIAAVSGMPVHSYAQENTRNCDTNPRVTLEDAKLDVLLELTMNEKSQAKFKLSFLDAGTENVHQHIDYAFEIADNNGTRIFSAVPPGQPTLHTAEGVVTIPYTFQKNGDYVVNVIVYGVDFIPTIPQVATFPCNDIPEFPASVLSLVAAIMGVGIVVSRYLKLRG
jgi:hypothetical protein